MAQELKNQTESDDLSERPKFKNDIIKQMFNELKNKSQISLVYDIISLKTGYNRSMIRRACNEQKKESVKK